MLVLMLSRRVEQAHEPVDRLSIDEVPTRHFLLYSAPVALAVFVLA